MNYLTGKSISGMVVIFSTFMARADAGLPDPTRPADYTLVRTMQQVTPTQRAEFHVNAIRISDLDRSAIVNGKLVRAGDTIGSATVSEIKTAEVVLNYEKKLLIIPLYAQGFSKQFKTPENRE